MRTQFFLIRPNYVSCNIFKFRHHKNPFTSIALIHHWHHSYHLLVLITCFYCSYYAQDKKNLARYLKPNCWRQRWLMFFFFFNSNFNLHWNLPVVTWIWFLLGEFILATGPDQVLTLELMGKRELAGLNVKRVVLLVYDSDEGSSRGRERARGPGNFISWHPNRSSLFFFFFPVYYDYHSLLCLVRWLAEG